MRVWGSGWGGARGWWVRCCLGRERGPGGEGYGKGALWLTLSTTALAWSAITRWGQLALLPIWLVALLPAIRQSPSRVLRAALWAIPAGAAILLVQLWLVFTVA